MVRQFTKSLCALAVLAAACSLSPTESAAQATPKQTKPDAFTLEDPTAPKSWVPESKPKERLNAEVQIPRAPNEPGGCITADAPVSAVFQTLFDELNVATVRMEEHANAEALLVRLSALAKTPAEKLGVMRQTFLLAATSGDRPRQLQALTALATSGQLCRDELEQVVAAIDQLKKPLAPFVPQAGP